MHRGPDSEDGEFDDQDAELERLYPDEAGPVQDELSETMSTGYDDGFDEEIQRYMGRNMDDDEHGFDEAESDADSAAASHDWYYPGDGGYDLEFEIDHGEFQHLPGESMDVLLPT